MPTASKFSSPKPIGSMRRWQEAHWGSSWCSRSRSRVVSSSPSSRVSCGTFGGAGGGSYSVYQWNSGYAAQTNQPTQAQAFSVASVSKFFEGTSETPGPVYGFRIDNDGEADTKIVVMSGNSFSDNPLNPMLVPEPSVFLMSLAGGLFLLGARRR